MGIDSNEFIWDTFRPLLAGLMTKLVSTAKLSP
jgi:hypothetical protein